MQTALFIDDGSRSFVVVVIAAHDTIARNDDFADARGVLFGVFGVDGLDFDFDRGQRHADRSDFVGIIVDRDDGGVFGHAIAFEDADAKIFEKRGDFGRERSATADAKLDASAKDVANLRPDQFIHEFVFEAFESSKFSRSGFVHDALSASEQGAHGAFAF